MSASKLKNLQSRKNLLTKELQDAAAKHEELQAKIVELRKEIESTEKDIEELQAEAPIVSEHALVRYLERVKGIDMEAIQREILESGSLLQAKEYPNGTFEIGNGFVAVVRDKTVVTIKEKGVKRNRVRKPSREMALSYEDEHLA